MAQGAEYLPSPGISALPSAYSIAPRQELERAFPGCTSRLFGWKCGSRTGYTQRGAFPQTSLQDELWCKQSSCSGCCWLLPVPEPISLGINQPELQHGEPFQAGFSSLSCLMLWKHRAAVLQQLRQGKDTRGGKGLAGLERNKKHQLVGRYQIDVVSRVLLSIFTQFFGKIGAKAIAGGKKRVRKSRSASTSNIPLH